MSAAGNEDGDRDSQPGATGVLGFPDPGPPLTLQAT